MKTVNILIILFILHFSFAVCQPSIQWQKSFGGAGTDNARYGVQTSDGGFIVVGQSNSTNGDLTANYGAYDFWVTKLNSIGNLLWQKNYGGSADDIARCVKQTTDGGYLVFGDTYSNSNDVTGNHGGKDYWLIKLNSTGTLVWQKTFGGTGNESAKSIVLTNDGGIALFGYSGSNDGDVLGNHGGVSDYWLVKTDGNGNIQWKSVYGGSDTEEGDICVQTNDGGFILSGTSMSNDGDVTGNHGGFGDYWIVKTNNTGVITWQKCFGGSGAELAREIIQTSDGNYLVAGYSDSNDGDVTGNHGLQDYWVVKLTVSGGLIWQKSLGGTNSEWPYAVTETNLGTYVISGNSQSNNGDVTGNHGGWDYWIVNLSSSGSVLWQKSFGGSMNDESNFSVNQCTDNGLFITGRSNSNDGDVSGNQGSNDYWVVKTGSLTGVNEFEKLINIHFFPNPTKDYIDVISDEFQFSFKLFDIIGGLVLDGKIDKFNNRIDLSDLKSGTYIIKFGSQSRLVVKN